MMKKILLALTTSLLIVILAGIYKFNYLANQDGYTVDGNKINYALEVVCDENLVHYQNKAEAQKARACN